MPYIVDFNSVSTVGLESSPVAAALAGLRANEARYFKNKYDHVFTVEPASDGKATIEWVHRILKEERDIVISSRPLEATAFEVENIRMAYVFYESGLSINVMYTIDEPYEAGGRVQALRRDGSPRGARLAVQVRQAEVEAGRNHPRFLLRLQERLLNCRPTRQVGPLLPWCRSAARRRFSGPMQGLPVARDSGAEVRGQATSQALTEHDGRQIGVRWGTSGVIDMSMTRRPWCRVPVPRRRPPRRRPPVPSCMCTRREPTHRRCGRSSRPLLRRGAAGAAVYRRCR